MWFNQYPYINLNDLNLDFLLKAIRDMKYEVENFVSVNAIKYANPIQWNIRSQYEKNTVVIDGQTGTAYLSVSAVPSGVALNRTEYWTVIFDMQRFIDDVNKNLTSHYEAEATSTATFATGANGWLIWNGVLYKALTQINVGDAYVEGSNIGRITIENALSVINYNIDTEITNRENADLALQQNINNEATARQNADIALQNADVTLQQNINNEATARQNADLALSNRISDLENTRRFILLDSYGGYPTDKLSVALGELLGVEYEAESPVVSGNHDIRYTGGIGFTNANGQGTFTSFLTSIASEITNPSEIEELIVLGGANDYGGNGTDILNCIQTFCNYARTIMPNAVIKIGCLSASRNTRVGIENHSIAITAYRMCNRCGAVYLNNTEYIMHRISLTIDGLHPANNDNTCLYIASKVADAVLYGNCDVHYYGGENLTAYTPSGTFDTLTLNAGVYDFVLNNGIIGLNLYINGSLSRTDGVAQVVQNYNTKIATLADSSKIVVGRAQSIRPLIGAMPIQCMAYNDSTLVDTRDCYAYIDDDGDLEIALTYGSTGGITCNMIRFVTANGNGTFASTAC